jgi:hypothetical protein
MTKYELITCIISIISTSILVTGLIFTGIQLYLMRRANKNIHEWNRRKTTYDLLNDFSSGEFPKILHELKEISKTVIDETTNYDLVISKIPDSDKDRFDRKLNQLLNYFEGKAIAIKNHIIDEDICFDYAALVYLKYYNWSKPFITQRRHKIDKQSVYINFENLALKWSDDLEKEKQKAKDALISKGKKILK